MLKKVVYTAIYGNKDILKNPLFVNDDFDYICFTDNKNLKSDVWKIVYKESIHKDSVRSAKIFKVKPHEYFQNYDISLWIDANFIIKNNLNSFLAKSNYLEKTNMMLFQHDQGRNCVYNEAEVLTRDDKDDPDIIKRQMEKYKNDNYPVDRGLSANSIMLKKHNERDIIDLSNMWWEEIVNFSRRDQLSLYYCIWKLNIKHYLLRYPNVDIRNNQWFQWLPHNFESQKW